MRALIRHGVLCAWKGPSLFIVTAAGDAGGPGSLTGFYFREARFLSTLRLEIDGQRPWLCEAAAVAPDLLQFVYTYPEVAVYEGGGSGQSGDEEPRNRKGIPQRGIDLTVDLPASTSIASPRRRFSESHEGAADVRAVLDSRSRLRGHPGSAVAETREQQAPVDVQPTGDEIRFVYQHSQLPYVAAVSLTGAEWRTGTGRPSRGSGAVDTCPSRLDHSRVRRASARSARRRCRRCGRPVGLPGTLAQRLHEDPIAP